MRLRRLPAGLAGVVAIVLLSGCTAAVAEVESSSPSPSSAEADGAELTRSPEPDGDVTDQFAPRSIAPWEMPPADRAGQVRANDWLAAIELPPGAVELDTTPPDAATMSGSYTAWWCEPMGLARGYWLVPDLSVAETANWMAEHPTADLIVTTGGGYEDDPELDGVMMGHAPSFDAIEGIAFTFSRSGDGTAMRAEVGAFGDTTVCPESESLLGGPGQG